MADTAERAPAILVVEQCDNLALFMQEVLEGAGYNVICASSLAKARQAMRAGSFDLLLLDWQQDCPPLANLLATFPASQGRTSLRTIVAVDGRPGCDQECQALAQGAAHVMHKPFGLKGLLAAVDQVLAHFRQGRA